MNHQHSVDNRKDRQTFSSDTLANVLDQISHLQENSCLRVVYNSITFFIHFNHEGKLVYATNSLAPFERLERHLRRLSNQNPKLDNLIIKQPRVQFNNDLQSYTRSPSDYQAIFWLAELSHLNSQEATAIVRRITREVFESFLCLQDVLCQYKFTPKLEQIKELCQFDLNVYTAQCRQRLKAWSAFADRIWSTYQRPYLVTEKTKAIGDLTNQQNQAICKLLKGLNFRQISAVLDLDELAIAKFLYPSILDRDIIVRDPKPPFKRLPKLPQQSDKASLNSSWSDDDNDSGFNTNIYS